MVMTQTPSLPTVAAVGIPADRLNTLTQRFGAEKVALLLEAMQTGDALADAVIQTYDGVGSGGSRDLNMGIMVGLRNVPEASPALRAFLEEVEQVPAWVEPERIRRGAEANVAIGTLWTMLSLSAGSLVHTYSSASIARVLVKTGNLTKMAERRLIETGLWRISSVMPDGLERGAAGYVQNVQVRLLHARVRTTLLKRGWDVAAQGMPINQVEMARTWLDFTYIPFTALQQFGVSFSPSEIEDLYHFWQYLAYLLGIDERFYRGITNNTEAKALLDLIDSSMDPANEDSRALTQAMLNTLATFLQEMLKLPYSFTFDLVSAITRRLHGDTLADQLGVKRTWVSGLLPLLIIQNRWQRFRMRRDPAVRQKFIAQAMNDFNAQLAAITGDTVYQQNAQQPGQHPLPEVQ